MIDESVREEVVALSEKGVSIATIARQLGISRGSVYGILNGDGSGDDQPRGRVLNDGDLEDDQRDEVKHRTHRLRPAKGKGGPMSTLKEDAYGSLQYDFKTEMLQDEREEYRERKNRARKEELEQERLEKLERFRIVEQQRQAAEREVKARVVIQKIKNAVLPLAARDVYPTLVMASIYQEIEKILGRMDLLGIPLSELVILGTDIKNRILSQNIEAVRQSASEYLARQALCQVKQWIKDTYSDYREHGGELPMRDFILDNAGDLSPERQREFLNSIGL